MNEWAKWPGRSRVQGIKRAAGAMAQGPLHGLLRQLNGMNRLPSWIKPSALEEQGVLRRYSPAESSASESGRRVVAELSRALTKRGLPALLRHGDRNSMRFSVESRVPFLTLDMVDLLLSLPESYLISANGETKHVFRAAMRDIVPNDVLNRRDKIGFAPPEQEWLMSMASTVREWLATDLHLPFFDQAAVLKEFDLVVQGEKPFSWQVWRWINFVRWHQIYLG